MAKIEFTAFPRQGGEGRGASRRLRRSGKAPGIVYGGTGEPTQVELDHNALLHALKSERFHASILTMKLGSKSQEVLLRDVQMHPYRPLVLHIDFQRVDANKKIHMKVPLHFINAELSPAVKEGGAVVSHVLNEIDISCLPKDLPEFIEVDLSTLKATDTIKVLDLKLPQGVKAVVKGKENPVVVSVTIPGAVVEEEVVAVPVAAVEVPATAQKAPVAPAAAATPEKKGGKEEKGGDKKK